MRKKLQKLLFNFLLLVGVLTGGTMWGQGWESFSNLTSSGSYTTNSWTGDNNVAWKATDSRTDQTLNGKAICIRNGSLTNTSTIIGIGTLTFKYARAFTGNSTLKVIVNGTQYGNDISVSSDVATTISIPVNLTGNITIALTNSSQRTIIDDVSWTAPETAVVGEPTNQVTNLSKGTLTTSTLPISWTAAAAGTQSPNGYLAIANTGAITSPVDGTDPGTGSLAISSGAATYKVTGNSSTGTTFTGATPGTMYNIKVYSYTNSGTNINFKTDNVPSINIASLPNAVSGGTFTPIATTAAISWTAASGYNASNHTTLVFVKQSASSITQGTPTLGSENYTANTILGSGTAYQADSSAYCVYKGDGNSVNISGLQPNTAYNILVYTLVDAQNYDGSHSYSAAFNGSMQTGTIPVSIPYSQNFEGTTSEWTLETGTTNKWAIGSGTNNGGTKALYISNDNGVSNTYTTSGSSTPTAGTFASFRADLTNITTATLKFDWKCNGEVGSNGTIYDFGEVYINNGGSDILISQTQEFYNSTIWQSKIINLSAYIGNVVTIKFKWKNDSSSGNQPPFAIDNVEILNQSAPTVTTSLSNYTYNSASISTTVNNGNAIITAKGIVYNTTGTPSIGNGVQISDSGNNGNFTSEITSLQDNKTYYLKAYATNSVGTSYSDVLTFNTASIDSPLAIAAANITTGETGFIAKWNNVSGAQSYRLDVSTMSTFGTQGSVQLNEGFESQNIPSGYNSAADITLNSGIWNFADVMTTTSSNSGSTACQLKANAGTVTSPAISKISTVTFWAKKNGSGSTGTVKLKKIVNGVSTNVTTSPASLTTANWTLMTATINENDDTKLVFYNTGDNISILDDVTINHTAEIPSFVTGYGDLAVSGTSKNVTGLTSGTTYYYRVRAVGTNSTSANSNIIAVIASAFKTWANNVWTPSAPSASDVAVIQDNYNSDSFEAYELTVNNGATLNIETGKTVTIHHAITNNGGIIVNNNAALVLKANATQNGNGSFVAKRNSQLLYRLDYTMWSSPVAAQQLQAFSPNTTSSRFYRYAHNWQISASQYNELFYATSSTANFVQGAGYLVRMPNVISPAQAAEQVTPVVTSTNYNTNAATQSQYVYPGVFSGTPNNGNIEVGINFADVKPGNEGQFLNQSGHYISVGNPYPSPISVTEFLLQNQGVLDLTDANIYLWRKKNDATTSSYAKLSLTGYISNQGNIGGDIEGGGASFFNPTNGNNVNWILSPGQGFIVKLKENLPATAVVTFTNSMRRSALNNQAFFRTANDNSTPAESRWWLNLTGANNTFSQTLVGYLPQATLGMDYGYDGKAMEDGAITVYSTLSQDKMAVQARPQFEDTDVVTVGYNVTTAGQYTLNLDHVDGVFAQEQNIYLVDALTGTTTNLNQGAYTFITEAGSFDSRFTVVYEPDGQLGNATPQLDKQVMVYQQNNAINIAAAGTEITDVTIYDIRGRKLYEQKGINSTQTSVSSLGAAQQVLVVEVSTTNGKVSKKIIY